MKIESLPKEWTLEKIGDITEVSVGRDLKNKIFSEYKSKEYSFPVYSNKVEEEGLYGFYSKPEYQAPSVTVVGRGELGTAFKREKPFGAIGRLLVLKPNEKINASFLTKCINHCVHFFEESTGVPQLTGVQIKTYKVPSPPLLEQRVIVNILEKWDVAISTLKKLIKAKKRYKKGLMQQLLSGKKRFPEFVKSKDKFETKFGNYPEDWRYPKIKTLAKQIRDRKEPKKDAYTVLSCTKYDGLVNSLEYFDRQVFSDDLSNYKVVEKGTFAYATNHIEEGSIGYNDWCENGLISPMYKVFKTDQEKVNDQYLYRVFKTEKYRHIFEINTNGTVNRRGSLNWKSFENIRVPLPPLEEQNKIADIMQRAEQEIALLEQELKAIKKQKKGLIQQLLTGKIRVNQGITKAESYG